jgi:hypothetical protein
MLQRNEYGRATNWEESKTYLETHGLLDRNAFEQEIANWRQDERYTFKNAEFGFMGILRDHIGQRASRQKPGYHDYPSLKIKYDERRCAVYLGLDWRGTWKEVDCAAPDWLTDLFWEEADQRTSVGHAYPIGTLLYGASANKMYVVYEQDYISAKEAAEMEETNDIFDAVGPYSNLCYPRTEEERARAQVIWEAQQGYIGSLEEFEIGFNSPAIYRPKILLPGKGSTHQFESYGDHKVTDAPPSSEAGHWFKGERPHGAEQARAQAETFLKERYPNVRLVAWEEFKKLETQRIG